MYEKVNKLGITENHVQVLTLFTNGFDREYYGDKEVIDS
jgi:hypothetical protein